MSEQTVSERRPSRANHPATDGIDVNSMAFVTPEDNMEFPHPGDIQQLMDDAPITATTRIPTNDADPEAGAFLAMDATEVYAYLETMQKKTDWWLKTELEDLKRRHLSQDAVKLSNADKQWIVEFERKRRAETYGEWNPQVDTKGWQSLPNAHEEVV